MPGKKELRIRRLCQGAVRLFDDCVHVGRFSFDWEILRKTPRRPAGLRSWKWRAINRHLVFGQSTDNCPGKYLFDEHVLVENQVLAHSWRSEFLEDFDGIGVKVIPARHRTNAFHEGQTADEFRPACCQMKC